MPSSRRRFFKMPNIDQPDPEPGFVHSSDEFVIPSRDEEGLSRRCQFKAPEQLASWAADIVASKKFPFQREGDLMRYGLYLACVQLSRIETGVPNFQGTIDAQAQVVRSRMNHAAVIGHLDHLGQEVEKLRKMSAWGEITYILAGERRRAHESEKSEPFWGSRWAKELEERFGHIARQAESHLDCVSLKPSEAFRAEPAADTEDEQS